MNKHQRAAQLWSLLILAAQTQRVLSYRGIESMTGIARQGVGDFLGPIQDYCKRNDFPPLTALVINEGTGMPGVGFTGAPETDVFKAQARCFVFDWTGPGRQAPSPDDFAALAPGKPSV